MMYERLVLAKDLLSETGSIFVHCDWRVNFMLRGMLEEIFSGNLRNEIIWCYRRFGIGHQRQFTRAHDNILWFSKSADWKFDLDAVRIPYSEKTKANFIGGIGGSGFGSGELNEKGKIPEDFMIIAPAYKSLNEVLPYPTQKPEALLKQFILGASDVGDLVADLFCGCGTTGAVAERLGRRWIMADLGRFAVHTSRKRLIDLQRKLHDEGESYRDRRLPFARTDGRSASPPKARRGWPKSHAE
jgi:adenine specific DNA methylase Mod